MVLFGLPSPIQAHAMTTALNRDEEPRKTIVHQALAARELTTNQFLDDLLQLRGSFHSEKMTRLQYEQFKHALVWDFEKRQA